MHYHLHGSHMIQSLRQQLTLPVNTKKKMNLGTELLDQRERAHSNLSKISKGVADPSSSNALNYTFRLAFL